VLATSALRFNNRKNGGIMNPPSPRFAIVIAGLCLCLAAAVYVARAQSPGTGQKEASMPLRATGTFEVKAIPQPPDPAMADSGISRLLLDKQFHGDLEASSKGQMLACGGPPADSGGYVGIERLTGTLAGRSGSFALQHSGTMDPGGVHLSVTVVPGSGTGRLAGIAGSMTILMESGKHSYSFDYTLPAAR